MATKEELQEMVNTFTAVEKALIADVEQAVLAFNDNLEEIVSRIPSNPAPMTPASTALLRIANTATNQFLFELTNLKSQYNMNGVTVAGPAA